MSWSAFGPEFALLVRCCRWNFNKAEQASAIEPGQDLDWHLFVALAGRHRVQGLAWNALAKRAESLPDHAKQALSSDARSIAATNLAIAAECQEIRLAFERAEVPLLFVKGLSVGALAYRSPLLKMGWDIDLLIDPGALDRAASLLSERGYQLCEPRNLAALGRWHGWSKESVWSDGRFHVELHTRLADNGLLIPTIDVRSARQDVAITPQISLPTLAEEELLAYLAVHGASSAWSRLKWIADFAALLEGRSGEEVERLYRRSQRFGAARAAGQALLVADRLFDTLGPSPALRAELESDRSTRLLCHAALGMMTKGTDEPTARRLGTLPIHWTQFVLKPGLGYKFSELRRQAAAVVRR